MNKYNNIKKNEYFNTYCNQKYSPVIQQYLRIKNKYPNMLLFYQMGDFYELFFEDAKKISELLKITLTKKKSLNTINIPMAGVPCHTANYYLSKLLNFGESIVICEQVDNQSTVKNLLERKVVKIITPGTVLEDSYLIDNKDNLLAAVYQEKNKFGYATLNLSLGCINISEHKNLDSFLSELERTNPKEILCSKNFSHMHFIQSAIKVHKMELWEFDLDIAKQQLSIQFGFYNIKSFDIEENVLALRATGCLFQYVKNMEYISLNHIKLLKINEQDDIISMNVTTRRNLEISENLNGKDKYTLSSILDYTSTSMGSRMLKRWLHAPLRNVQLVKKRQKIVINLIDHFKPIKKFLNKIGDLERMISRVSSNIATPRDFERIRYTFHILPKLNSLLLTIKSKYIKKMAFLIGTYNHLYLLLKKAISESPSNSIKEGNVIAQGYSSELDKWRDIQNNSLNYLKHMEVKERNKLGINTLKIGFNSKIGYYIQINNRYNDIIPNYYIKKQVLKSCIRYTVDFLKDYEYIMLNSKLKVLELEKKLYSELFQIISPDIIKLQKTALILAELDVLTNFSERSIVLNYVCPIIHKEYGIVLKKSRHPVIEFFSDTHFIPNNINLNKKNKMLLITGPNMGGKSTYMRQIALIVILAWIGSFVPASYAKIGRIDKIFTRIGAKDNIHDGQSTFMVEMMETANIMNNATGNSLILIDELGRGTSIYDAISLAWACAIFLIKNIKGLVLFSTHYFELTNLSKKFLSVKNVFFEVVEINNSIVFTYKLKPGICKKSCGLFVAKLSGLPSDIIHIAEYKLKTLQTKNFFK